MSTPSATLERLLRDARAGRCLLREKWEEGAVLDGRGQLRLVRELAKIKPATVERHGHRVPCEAKFQLKPKDRRRLVEALLGDGMRDGEIQAAVPGLTRRTFERIKRDMGPGETGAANRSSKRRISTKRDARVVRPQTAFLDATSGSNAEAAERFRALVEGPA